MELHHHPACAGFRELVPALIGIYDLFPQVLEELLQIVEASSRTPWIELHQGKTPSGFSARVGGFLLPTADQAGSDHLGSYFIVHGNVSLDFLCTLLSCSSD